MHGMKDTGEQRDLNAAAEDSVKDAINRGRTRRPRGKKMQDREVALENPGTAGGNKRVAPMEQKLFVPYLKRRKTSLIPEDNHGEGEDSNDEWEAKIEVDPKVMEAAVASLKDSKEEGVAKSDEVSKKENPSQKDFITVGTQEPEKPSEVDVKAQQRLQAAAKRKKFLLRHSVHIVLSIAHCIRLDAAANDDEVRGFALSVTPMDTFLSKVGFCEGLSRFGLWLRTFFQTAAIVGEASREETTKNLECCFSASARAIRTIQYGAGNILDVLSVTAAIVRAQGFRCRIVLPLQLVPSKPSNNTRKENKVTGRTQVVEVQPDRKAEFIFYGWLEIWARSRNRWIPFDVFGGRLCDISPAETITFSIERIPSFDILTQPSMESGSSPREKVDADKPERKPRKSIRTNKRHRPGTSPSPPLRKVHENMFLHVIAVENGRITDVTTRYTGSWSSIEKARAKGKLLDKAIKDLSAELGDPERDEALMREQEEFEEIAAADEIPTSISAIQRHPRYVLERHLKKYEMVYPKEPIVGHIKEEPIYLRNNVQLLHTKDRWIRQMRVVKASERPLKAVRSMNGTDATVDLFGSWQTDPLVIAPCVNGKVPRGIHGNVDLWTPAHLPNGTAHVNLPYAKIAARKLQVDFAPAMTGFDIRGGRSVPRIEGIVVAVENEDLVRDAASATAQAAAERKEKRAKEDALDRWLKLFRAVKARQKVKTLYGSAGEAVTYEAVQKQEGLERARAEKRGTQDATNASKSAAKASNASTTEYNASNGHIHEFDEPKRLHGDTMVRVCKICGLEMAYEVL